jgi:uncharacterized protein YecT (DUF1311 family)
MPRLSSRFLFTISALLTLLIASTGRSQDVVKPKASDNVKVHQCFNTAIENGNSPVQCIGLASEACQSEPNMASTIGMSECNWREQAVWDTLLNKYYQDLRKGLTKNGKKILRDIQKVWITWRDKKCELPYALAEGGSIARPLATACTMRATALRAIELADAAGVQNR